MVKHREVTNEWTLPEKSTVLAPLQAALISQKKKDFRAMELPHKQRIKINF